MADKNPEDKSVKIVVAGMDISGSKPEFSLFESKEGDLITFRPLVPPRKDATWRGKIEYKEASGGQKETK